MLKEIRLERGPQGKGSRGTYGRECEGGRKEGKEKQLYSYTLKKIKHNTGKYPGVFEWWLLRDHPNNFIYAHTYT